MSVFSNIPPDEWFASNDQAFAIRDRYPVNEGHTLVIPKQPVPSWFGLSLAQRVAMIELVDEVKARLDGELHPNGYNIGINDGAAAGQTVDHVHVHVIPRWDGDVDDPRGGVRFVIPARGNYFAPGHLPRPAREAGPWHGAGVAASAEHQLARGGLDDPFEGHLRPALRRASSVHIVAAFVLDSGVRLLDHAIDLALARGARFEVITGDYLHITQVQALHQLLDRVQGTLSDERCPGSFEVRVIETASLGGRAFHPKSWRLEGPELAAAWVGSSNWSRSALTHGVEWNLRVDRHERPDAYGEIVDAFGELWRAARLLDLDWLERYAARAQANPSPALIEVHEPTSATTPEPRGVQPRALEALAAARAQGRSRALVVLATGLGKTYLSAFDVRNFIVRDAMGASPERGARVLFVAHRSELLAQAARTFRAVFPDAGFGLFAGGAEQLDARFVFASIQKLTRPEHLDRLAVDAFDYVIIDEAHHAAADSYRRLLARLEPEFILGLTATPERADDADVAALFDDHVAFRADLIEGIRAGHLVPFRYHGVRDTIAYDQHASWSSYTTKLLTGLASDASRMDRLWRAWTEHPGSQTLVFCVSIAHADYVAAWLRERGVTAQAVHTGPESGDRDEVLERFGAGALQAVVAVDLFNEGLDVPCIDRVVMLRPTDSPVVFVQQLGRGLRVAEGKSFLQVIDFVGNHKVFLERLRTLLSFARNPPSLREFVGRRPELELPDGCTIDVELELIHLLAELLPKASRSAVVQAYREIREARGRRPTPGELVRRGLNPAAVHKTHGHWYGFVDDEGDLNPSERAAVRGSEWLRELGRRPMKRPLEMVTLEVMLEHDALLSGVAIDALRRASHARVIREPVLSAELDPGDPDSTTWRRDWEAKAVAPWLVGKQPWFALEAGVLRFRGGPDEPDTREALERLTRHTVDGWFASYRRRMVASHGDTSVFPCKVATNTGGNPMIFLPGVDRDKLPEGEVIVRLGDGAKWVFRFVKIAINFAHPVGEHDNQLPALLRNWFGPNAGKSGTDARVQLFQDAQGWRAAPLGQVIALAPRVRLVSYPSLRAAAGARGDAMVHADAETVQLPTEAAEGHFAVRVSGDSMDGGTEPLRDGDWAVLEWALQSSLDAQIGRVVLVGRGDPDEGRSFHLKRVARDGDGRLILRSDNPSGPKLDIDESTVVIARLVKRVRPEQLAPEPGRLVRDWGEAFGLGEAPRSPWARVDGHLFVLIEDELAPDEIDQVSVAVEGRAVAETAFVLSRAPGGWRYLGVGHWRDGRWHIS